MASDSRKITIRKVAVEPQSNDLSPLQINLNVVITRIRIAARKVYVARFLLTIAITRACPESTIKELKIKEWPIWACEPSIFPWTYSQRETCLLIEGDVTVTQDGQAPVTFGAGDLVIFPAGLSCTWNIHKAVRKHYRFGE